MNLLLLKSTALSGLLVLTACSNTPPKLSDSDTLPAQGFEAEVVPLSGVGSSATAPRLLIRPSLAAQPISTPLAKSTKYNLAGQAMVIWGDSSDPMIGTLTVSVDGLGSITKINTNFASTSYFNNQPRGRYCVSVTWDLHNSKYSSVRTTPVTNCQWATEDNFALYGKYLYASSEGGHFNDDETPSIHSFPLDKEISVGVTFEVYSTTYDNPSVTLTTPMQRPVFLLRTNNHSGIAEITSASMSDGICSLAGGIATCIANHALPPDTSGLGLVNLKVQGKKAGISGILVSISSTSVIGWDASRSFPSLTGSAYGERNFLLNLCLGSDPMSDC